jgi:hypothetical protein
MSYELGTFNLQQNQLGIHMESINETTPFKKDWPHKTKPLCPRCKFINMSWSALHHTQPHMIHYS